MHSKDAVVNACSRGYYRDRSSPRRSDLLSAFDAFGARDDACAALEWLYRGAGGTRCQYAADRADLAGLPQTYIGAGALDLLLEGAVDYEQRLIRAGVALTLEVVPDAFHGFDGMSQSPLAAGFLQSHAGRDDL